MNGENDRVRHVVIVGGGTAGWMTAAALGKLLDARRTRITLVESDAIGTVGVGEATIPAIQDFNRLLGIDEREMLRVSKGTYKLGIELVDWWRVGHRYMHPFGTFGRDTPLARFHQLWLRWCHETGTEAGPDSLAEFSMSAVAAKLGRFAHPVSDADHPLSTLDYAFHFDAGLYAHFLRRWSEARGVVRVEGTLVDVEQRGENGFIDAVLLSDGRRIEGDLFVDCSGFRAILIDRAMRSPFVDWSRWLPCDRAVALPSASVGSPLPYTRATADNAGWRWRIPLQHRVGNGYVYASDHLGDEAACARLRATIEGEPLGEPRFLSFKAGHRPILWERNCVAIGLSGGFLEPLESTSIHLIQMGIARLMLMFPDRSCAQPLRDEYNRQSTLEYQQIRDFLILHYKATERDDAPLWRQLRGMPIPDTLQHKMDLFADSGRLFRTADDLFTEDSWLAVLIGQGVRPRRHDPAGDAVDSDFLERAMIGIRAAIHRAASAQPAHQQALAALHDSRGVTHNEIPSHARGAR